MSRPQNEDLMGGGVIGREPIELWGSDRGLYWMQRASSSLSFPQSADRRNREGRKVLYVRRQTHTRTHAIVTHTHAHTLTRPYMHTRTYQGAIIFGVGLMHTVHRVRQKFPDRNTVVLKRQRSREVRELARDAHLRVLSFEL